MTAATVFDPDLLAGIYDPASDGELVALSLGAGVQSTTLALLALDGTLPRPHVAIFADTGWEPAAVYAHLDRLEAVMRDAGVPLLKVSKGNLREDMLSVESRFTTIPYFILAPEGETPVMVECGDGCAGDDCEGCGGTGEVPHPTLRRPLTRREREGMGRRQCTSEYKLGPIQRAVRALLGAEAPDYRRVPKGQVCEQWIGFSTDEIGRVSDHDRVSYVRKRYPLLELDMSRRDCERWLAQRGWGSTTKSACIGCPFHGNRQWRALRDGSPAEWADAVDFDERIRFGARGGTRDLSLQGEAFLHRSRLPLAQAPIDRVTSREWRERQGDLFEALADAEAGYDPDEDGDPDGCSPYGCRSGAPVVTMNLGQGDNS